MIKTRTWVIGIAAAAAVLAVLTALALQARREGTVVQVVQDGEVIREIDLSRVKDEYRFTVEGRDGGSNTVLVQPGRICIEAADCPDQICVHQGWLSHQAMPIVCLPHGLVIAVLDADADAVAR